MHLRSSSSQAFNRSTVTEMEKQQRTPSSLTISSVPNYSSLNSSDVKLSHLFSNRSASTSSSSTISLRTDDILSDCTLFVGDLSYFCTEAHLLNLFSPFGLIISVRIRYSSAGESHLFAFIKFERRESAVLAKQAMHGCLFLGRRLR